MRKISPFISVILMVLVLSGSQGFTFIRHNCSSCGTNEIFAAGAQGETCCCIHDSENPSHHHSKDELIFSDDCCTHETERLITTELIRTEVQPEVMPYFMAAVIIAVIPEQAPGVNRTYTDNPIRHYGRDLATLHCQIIS
jgi:hypothetical protein